MAGIVESVCHK